MVIKASSAAEIRQLVEALGGTDPVRREAAIARLSVIGPRAVDQLLKEYGAGASAPMQAAILRALDPISDPRTLPIARAAVRTGGDAGVAGVGALRSLLGHHDAKTAAEALDALLTTARDPATAGNVRQAAVESLVDLPQDLREPLVGMTGSTETAAAVPVQASSDAARVWDRATEGVLPDSPDALRAAVAERGATAPLTTLQHLIERVRDAESAGANGGEWLIVRGAIHQSLAQRGSRVALYDLRETLTAARQPLPVSFLSAINEIGDASCLEPLAEAFDRAGAGDSWWRHQLVAAFRAILKREQVTKRSAVLKRVASKHPRILEG